MMNRKRQIVEIKKMERVLKKEFNDFVSKNKDGRCENDEQALKAWNEEYNEDTIRWYLNSFKNSSDILTTGAVYMSIMTIRGNKHIKNITVIPNLYYYSTDDESVRSSDTRHLNIECIFYNCRNKNNPVMFWSWIPRYVSPLLNRNILDKDTRAYVLPLCEIHSMKVKKDFTVLSDFVRKEIIPLRDNIIKCQT